MSPNATAKPGEHYQLERVGFFVVDEDTKGGAVVLNRTVQLKDSWQKHVAPVAAGAPASKKAPAPQRSVRRVTTTSAEAQKRFDEGLLYLYAFHHDQAIRAFAAAAAADPECAMCWWGVALANGPHINNPAMDAEHAVLVAVTLHDHRGPRLDDVEVDGPVALSVQDLACADGPALTDPAQTFELLVGQARKRSVPITRLFDAAADHGPLLQACLHPSTLAKLSSRARARAADEPRSSACVITYNRP